MIIRFFNQLRLDPKGPIFYMKTQHTSQLSLRDSAQFFNQPSRLLLKLTLVSVVLTLFIFSCRKSEEFSQEGTVSPKVKESSVQTLSTQNYQPSTEELVADNMLSIVTALNNFTHSEYCSTIGILDNTELSYDAKLQLISEIGTNGSTFISALGAAQANLSNIEEFTTLSSANSFSDEVVRIMMEERDIIYDGRPKANCGAYNAQVKAIGNAWLLCCGYACGEVNLLAIAGCCVAALDGLAANDAAYPECANGGNQNMPGNFWLHLPKNAMCNDIE